MAYSREELLRKIDAMLRKSEDESCTEEERASYAAMAMKWMGDHAIAEHEVGSVSEKPKKMVKTTLDIKYANGWRVSISNVVADNCGVYCTYQSRANNINYWGQEHMVAGAQMVAEYLVKHIEKLSSLHAKIEGTGTKGRRDFAEGCAYRVGQRVQESYNLSADMNLPVIMKTAAEEGKAFLLETLGKTKVKESTRLGAKRSAYTDSFEKGIEEGDRVNLRGHQEKKQLA